MSNQVIPIFENNLNAIVFASDNNYAPYLVVCINSIICNSSEQSKYDICILDGGICKEIKYTLYAMQRSNISIRFIDMSNVFSNYDTELFCLYDDKLTIATYYRVFLSSIFSNYQKILYLDVDMILRIDVATYFFIDISNYLLAGVKDIPNIFLCQKNEKYANYFIDVLKLDCYSDYINAGFMLCNIQEWKKIDIEHRLIDKLKELKKPKYSDQCLVNSVCKGKIKYLHQRNNFQMNLCYYDDSYFDGMPIEYLKEYDEAFQSPNIIHYTGQKPWEFPNMMFASEFFKYAINLPIFSEILKINSKYIN